MKSNLLSFLSILSLCTTAIACSQNNGITDNSQSTELVTSQSTSDLPEMTVYKSPTCGCCKDWVTYIEKAGYSVTAINHDNVDAIKAEHGLINPALKSCHTALVSGYVIEGHVPIKDIERLLTDRPEVVGLTAPGMPMMSPGMGSEIPKDYDVLVFDKDGNSSVFSSY